MGFLRTGSRGRGLIPAQDQLPNILNTSFTALSRLHTSYSRQQLTAELWAFTCGREKKNFLNKEARTLCVFFRQSDESHLSYKHSHVFLPDHGDSDLTLVVSGNEAKDVLVSQHHRLINFCLAKPRSFVSGGEYFHGHVFPTPSSMPHFPESTFSYNFLKNNSPRNCSLHQKRQT